MALPTLSECKAYLKVEVDDEDDLITSLLASATGMLETYLGRKITAASVAATDRATSCARYRGVRHLVYPDAPISGSVTITDGDGTTVASATYTVDAQTGIVYGEPGVTFDNGPYTLTATAGLSAASDYATRIEPILAQAILDVVADLWRHREAGAQSEQSGAGVGLTWLPTALPPRTRLMVDTLRRVAVA